MKRDLLYASQSVPYCRPHKSVPYCKTHKAFPIVGLTERSLWSVPNEAFPIVGLK